MSVISLFAVELALLLWRRRLSSSDMVLGAAMLGKAAELDLGQRLRFA